jgi:hypothetical protein
LLMMEQTKHPATSKRRVTFIKGPSTKAGFLE